jgi:hypothetical protein
MNIIEGNFEQTDLSGLSWAVMVHWPKALHDGNGTAVVYIDEAADEAQREALGKILSGQVGGAFFEIFASIVTTVHGPHFVPIEWQFDQERRTARLAVADQFETETRALTVPATGEEQRISVRMPGGFEYKEAEVAEASRLSSNAEIKFDWTGTHSSLATVEHTDEALVA